MPLRSIKKFRATFFTKSDKQKYKMKLTNLPKKKTINKCIEV